MGEERADLGFGDELKNFDPDDWAPKARKAADDRAAPEAARKAASETGFQSREATNPQAPQRRRRTGRNVQFNIKSRPETIAAFCAIADGQGWGLGETLEHAVALLERAHPTKP